MNSTAEAAAVKPGKSTRRSTPSVTDTHPRPTFRTGKKTIFVTGFSSDVNEQELVQAFITFGE
jgi:RNA recognition motif-containing protein